MAKAKTDLDAGREELKIRSAPYSQPMSKGVALLLYKGKIRDRWGARTPHGDRVIGTTDDLTYEQARTKVKEIVAIEAKTGAKALDQSDDPDSTTFGDVWQQYMRWANSTGKTPEMLANLRSHGNVLSGIFPMKVSDTKLSDLNKWRDSLIGSTGTNGRMRSAASVGRAIASFKAALSRAAIDGEWRTFKTGVKKVQAKKRIVALMDEELRAFTDAAYDHSHDFGVFVQALALTGARPKELRLATVGDLMPDGLLIRHGKTASKTGHRTIPLSSYAMTFFKGLIAGRVYSRPFLAGIGHRVKRAMPWKPAPRQRVRPAPRSTACGTDTSPQRSTTTRLYGLSLHPAAPASP